MAMTRNAALLTSLGVLAVLIFAVTTLTFDPFHVRDWWRDVASATSPYEDTDYLYDQASQFYRNDDRALAHDVARRILILQPGHKNAHKLLAAIYLKNQDFASALAECREVSRIDPTDVTSQLGMASALREMGHSEEASRILETVIQSEHSTREERDEAEFRLSQVQSPATPAAEPDAPPVVR
jgi:cytochrome c-type biogenesis protein CcmH/NrfG